MTKAKPRSATAAFEKSLAEPDKRQFVLRLYVTGMTPRSVRAIANITEICEGRLKGRYQLEVIDVYQQPVLARGQQIIAVPTLIKKLPPPLRRIIGDLSDRAHVLIGLGLDPMP